jgi:ABC-2 type transport system ATP-binding protein
MNQTVAIEARDVCKRFSLRTRGATSLKERLVTRRRSEQEDLWALQNVSTVIHTGETVGLIGANGAGKSTLLKVLSGIVQPTTGSVEVRGRVASLLELGAGFTGELSGRDNVYLNAALLGLSRREVDRLFDDIVAFAELEDFIDNEVKHYSSGMYVRLGFAVAVHVDPDVLLVDEVLAVGDEKFQRKCLDKIESFQRAGKTILFVTHSLDLVENLCTRGIVLDHGNVIYDGEAGHAAGTLRGVLGTGRPRIRPPLTTPGLVIKDARITSVPDGPRVEALQPDQPMVVTVDVVVEPGSRPRGGDVVVTGMGAGDIPIFVLGADKHMGAARVPDAPGLWRVTFEVPSLPHLYCKLTLNVSVQDPTTGQTRATTRFHDTVAIAGGHASGIVELVQHSSVVSTGPLKDKPLKDRPLADQPLGVEL